MSGNSPIPIKNVYYMLAYAFRALQVGEYADLRSEDFEDAHDLFAAILAKGIAKQVKQGLYRDYTLRAEGLATLRGKLELSGTTRLRVARSRKLACEYDELSENNLPNQILKTTAQILVRQGDVKESRRADLKRILLFFDGVDEINPTMIRWSDLRFTRNNRSYRVLTGVCHLVLEGMLLVGEQGDQRLREFLDDQEMHRLYEKFILEYYAKHWACLRPRAAQVKWALDEGEIGMLPTMNTDVTLSFGGDELIIDAKYYAKNTQENFQRHSIHSANLYQIFTYVKNRELQLSGSAHELSGMLLYARTDDAIQPEGDYVMSGNAITVTTLDLGVDFSGIAGKLDSIASEHFPGATRRD